MNSTDDNAAGKPGARTELFAPRQLDDKGRCCGKKPLVYRSRRQPMKFCGRCCRAYDLETGKQIANWAYEAAAGGNFLRDISHLDDRERRYCGPSLGFAA